MLDEIIKNKRNEILELKKNQSMELNDVLDKKIESRGFLNKLKKNILDQRVSIIAEIKRASPSKGFLDKNLNIVKTAIEYEKSGATCISVLTDQKFFKGSIDDLINVRNATNLPILRKDFILDDSQIIESKLIGADCILLIIAALDKKLFSRLYDMCIDLNLDVLVEVHNKDELQIALEKNCNMVGINNRNLKTFETSIQTTIDLIKIINNKDMLIVSESGIFSSTDIDILKKSGVNTFLIGEMLIKSNNISRDLQELLK
tara:strand:+ start:5319 stop:6098 length:780 start_codon:yes stop_codon:yes gene_type:complete